MSNYTPYSGGLPEKSGIHSTQVQYDPVPPPYAGNEYGNPALERLIQADEALKRKIRTLKLVSRLLATLLSIAVFVPMALTVNKFINTKDIYRDVLQPDGTTLSRTAWALETKSWPTWMYFAIAGVTMLLNLIIVLSYLRGIKSANRAASVASAFTTLVLVGHILVWVVSVIIYRYEKGTNGVENDLWAWSCSSAAETIQETFSDEINFKQYCTTQSTSWFLGLIQTVVSILSGLLILLAVRRKGSKKRAIEANQRISTGF